MLRRRNLLTTLLIALPWALLLTLWHQYPTTRYLSLLRSKCKSSAVTVLVAVMSVMISLRSVLNMHLWLA